MSLSQNCIHQECFALRPHHSYQNQNNSTENTLYTNFLGFLIRLCAHLRPSATLGFDSDWSV